MTGLTATSIPFDEIIAPLLEGVEFPITRHETRVDLCVLVYCRWFGIRYGDLFDAVPGLRNYQAKHRGRCAAMIRRVEPDLVTLPFLSEYFGCEAKSLYVNRRKAETVEGWLPLGVCAGLRSALRKGLPPVAMQVRKRFDVGGGRL